MEKQYIYRTNDLYEFNTLEEAKKHAELNESCDTITQYNIFSEDDYEEPKQVWVRESRLVEGTSNFGWVAPLPLLVFYTDDEILSMMDYDDENPRNHYDDYETEDAYYDAVEKYEDEYLNKIGICVLSEEDVDRLDKALDDLNSELKGLSDDFYDQAYELETDKGYEENKEEVDYLYDQSVFLDDVATFRIKSGYYEAAYIDCKNNKEIKDLDKEYQDMIFNKINEIKKEFGLTEMEVAWGPASNGETGYRKVESLKEDEEKKDSIYYCLSDKKMPKHSILLYGEEGRDKLLEIAPKYLEYYGQAEIFKSVNGHKTTIWEDGKLIEEEPTIKIKPDSEKVVIDKEDTSEVGEPGNPVQQGLKGVSKLENLNEAHLDYSDNLGEFIFNGTNYWVKGEKSHTRDYHWQEVYIKDTDHIYETVGYGKYKWLNRPWYRFEYDPAFKQAFLRAFGTKYEKFITDIIDSSRSVRDCCEKITKSSDNLDDSSKEGIETYCVMYWDDKEDSPVAVFEVDVMEDEDPEEIAIVNGGDKYTDDFPVIIEPKSEISGSSLVEYKSSPFIEYIKVPRNNLKEAFNGEEIFVHVFDIDYYVTEEDVDNESEIEEIKAKLPQDLYFSFEEYFEDDSELEERIADAISDETGWLVETFDYELLSEEEYNHYSQLKEAKKKKEKVRFVGNPEKEMAFFNHTMGSDSEVSIGESKEESLKESRDDERVAHYQELLDELYVTPKETELILKTADEYEKTAQKGWITYKAIDKITEKLGLKHLSQLDLSRMWEIVYYTLEKAAFENNGENYEKYSDAASAFAEVINMEARRRKEHTNSDANLEGIIGDRFAIDNDGLLYLYTSAMKDLIAWAKRRGKSIDELLDMSITKTKDGQTGTLRLKDYSIEFKRLWDQVREKLEIKENK